MLAICESCSLNSSLSRSLARGCFFNKRRVPRSQILSSSSSRRQLVTWPSYSKSAWASNRLYPLPSALDSCRKSQYSHIGPGGASIHIDTLEPPGPVHGWPTPLLSREDWMKYSRPLEARGWRVAQIDHISDKPLDCTLLSNSELKMTIVFREEDFEKNSEQFISILSSLEKEENHHVSLARDEREFSIALALHTHSAIRPEAYPGEPKKNRKLPGITTRDVRFATLLENLLDKAYYPISRREL